MLNDKRFDNYTQLLSKVDEMFSAVQERHPKHFNCQKGCFGCCKAGLSVTNVEAMFIRSWLQENLDLAEKQRELRDKGGGKDYCQLLDADGNCSIYPVRPLICRSHGMPVSWQEPTESNLDESIEHKDVCPLNFKNIDLGGLPRGDVLSLEKINVLLSLIDRQFDPDKAGQRQLLSDI